MAIALVNKLGLTTATGVTAVSVTLTVGVSAGDTVIVAATWGANNGGTLSATDSRSNTYVSGGANITGGASTQFTALFTANVGTALQIGDTITFHTTTSVNSAVVAAYDFSGLQVTPLDQNASQTTSGSNPTSTATATTAQASELLIGVLCAGASPLTAGSGYTALDTDTSQANHHLATEYQIVAATGTYAATWTAASNGYNALIGTFKASTASAPVNTVAPAVTGTQHVGQTLTTTNGTWTDDGSPTFSYQWQRDNSGGGTYSNIASATATTYTLVAADDGCNVRCVVTDSTPDGNTSANSNAVAITYAAPTNTVAPVASGSATVGSVLSCDTGTWTT